MNRIRAIFKGGTMKRMAAVMIGMALLFFPGAVSAKTWTVGFVTGVEQGIQSGFIQMTSQGLFKAKQEHGFRLVTETPENVSQEAMAEAFRKLIDEKPDLIVATGFQMSEHVRTFASRHPETLFLMNDVSIDDMTNVMSIHFAEEEGCFLAGALAGWMTKTGTVGVIGGVNVPSVIAFMTGFREGVRYAAPQVEIRETFVSRMPDFSGFSTPDKGATLAKEWYDQGTDIIFAAAGTTGNGIIHQAKISGKYAIGVDIDLDGMAVGHVLTSMLKRVDVAVYLAIGRIIQGKFQSGVVRYGLKENGVGLSEMKYTKHLIPDAVLKGLKNAEGKIVSGELKVANSTGDKK